MNDKKFPRRDILSKTFYMCYYFKIFVVRKAAKKRSRSSSWQASLTMEGWCRYDLSWARWTKDARADIPSPEEFRGAGFVVSLNSWQTTDTFINLQFFRMGEIKREWIAQMELRRNQMKKLRRRWRKSHANLS